MKELVNDFITILLLFGIIGVSVFGGIVHGRKTAQTQIKKEILLAKHAPTLIQIGDTTLLIRYCELEIPSTQK